MSDSKLPYLREYTFVVLDLISKEEMISNARKVLPDMIQKIWNLPNPLLQVLKKNGTPLHNDRVSWALTYLKKAGLIDFPKRGTALITKSGKDYLNEFRDVCEISAKNLMRIDSFKKFFNPKKQVEDISKNEVLINNDSSLINVSVDRMIFPELLRDLLESGYSVAHVNGALSIVRNSAQ
ncbi:winged helix-turn-helix domain-containing protein [Legionella sp. PC997]|uniref:winged helix-turn-helix domain-containing protein n=1 Tax=Legionella sp. PC997 TaxID=2755562 RepID=UPI0015FA39BF|nr:winged helix-turn-helix domain-containing protein [Legionella sp. PC997]QMT62103.1 hypothetical protein HBNCFIEN_03511 [Legionella sp. PC997]